MRLALPSDRSMALASTTLTFADTPMEFLDTACEPSGRLGSVRCRISLPADLHHHLHLVHASLARQNDLVVGRKRLDFEQHLLDLRREHVDAAHDHHVVGAAGHLLHASHAARGSGQKARQIARAVADHRHRLLGQRREHQFSPLAIGQAPCR